MSRPAHPAAADGHCDRSESAVGPIDVVYGHNDLLPTSIMDDGRHWLIDWDYAGQQSALRSQLICAPNNEILAADEAGFWRATSAAETSNSTAAIKH